LKDIAGYLIGHVEKVQVVIIAVIIATVTEQGFLIIYEGKAPR